MNDNAIIPQSLRLDPSRTGMILNHSASQKIVFGMDWSALVGSNPQGLGLKRSRALRATHFVIVGSGAMALGTTRLKSVQYDKKIILHSAAAHYAQRFPTGAFACLIPFDGNGCWMVACHAGVVLSNTDRWFADLGSALQAIEPIRHRFPALQIQTESTLTAETLPSWLFEKLCESSRLYPVRSANRLMLRAVLLLAGLVAVGMVFKKSLVFENQSQHKGEPDHGQLWRSAMQKLNDQISLHSYQSLASVTQSWQNVPVMPVGWKLRNIRCEAGLRTWQCAAHFDRQHRFSMNHDLERFKPVLWKTRAIPLESAAWLWEVPFQPLSHDWTQPLARNDWMTYLQRIGLAFDHIQIGTGAVLPIHPPLYAQRQPVPVPDSLPAWRHRSLFLKGPLRSSVLLEDLSTPIRWRHANLELGPVTGQNPASSSSLTLELTGEIFETTQN